MRPPRSFLLLLIFLVFFTGLHYFIPVSKLFPPLSEFVPDYLTEKILEDGNNPPQVPHKQVYHDAELSGDDTLPAVDTSSYTAFGETASPLQSFLDSLKYSKGQTRIIYYGDSQIEGDRITSHLRQSVRKDKGGTGPGLFLPVMPVMYTKTMWVRSSSNWTRYSYLSYKEGELSHRRLGPFMAICRYLPEGVRTTTAEKAFVRVKSSNSADSASSVYDILRVFYGNAHDIVDIVVKADNIEVFKGKLKKGIGFNEISCPVNGAEEIFIEFSGKVSPDIYGISIESPEGVITDNIPQRGSAGLEFTMVDSADLRRAYKALSPDLFILHYGLNVVKNVRDDYSYYKRGLSRQLALLKEISPMSAILVISLSDMAAPDGDSVKSFQNIPLIVEAQREAAQEAGVAFWDVYNAMGGESSIIRWTESETPYAVKDYVHFTDKGADTISKMLVNAIFTENEPAEKEIDSQGDAKVISDTIFAYREQQVGKNTKGIAGSAISAVFSFNPDKPFIFSSSAFWLFFLLVLAGYSLIYRKLYLRNGYLFLVSLFFYYKTGGLFLFLLILVTLIDFTLGLLIHNSPTKHKRRFFLIMSIISNLGILAWFKYSGFFISSINDLLGTDYRIYDFFASLSNSHLGTSFNISTIILPVGISFFTFQSLSYTFEVYRKKIEPVRNIIDFGFYVAFFPQLVAGPIVRASEFIPQIYNEYHLTKREFGHALFLISKGLIKKIIISDFIAVNFVDRVFDTPAIYSGFENLMAVYGYGLQIYCDFSGYTDIAIGLGLILGFRFPVNFNSPYKAAGIADFWKRWHISLSRWLKDYLYIPLGGNRKGKVRTHLNLMVTMLLGGLWHGAAVKFVIWGALHGTGLVVNRIWNSVFGEKFTRNRAGRAVAVFLTFNFVSFCWIFFRAADMESAGTIIRQIFENFSPGSYLTLISVYGSVFMLITVGYIIHFLPENFKESYRGLFIQIPVAGQMVIVLLVAILLYQMRATEVLPFIYFRF